MTTRAKVGVAVGLAVVAGLVLMWAKGTPAEPPTSSDDVTPAAQGVAVQGVAAHPEPAPDSVRPSPAPPVAGPSPEPTSLAPASGCATERSEDCPFLAPDDQTLAEMARCGIVRYDIPTFLDEPDHPTGFDDQWVKEAELTPQEREHLDDVARTFGERTREQAVELAIEAGLERAWAQESPFLIVIGMVQTRLDEQEREDSMLKVARERAGLEQPPAPGSTLSLADRTTRLLTGVGDRFERAVAERLGPQRAYELRDAADGWSGRGRSIGDRCTPAEPSRPDPADRVVPSTAEQARECVDQWRDGECVFLEPNKLMLDRMAKCGIVRFDFPTFLMTRDGDPVLDEGWAKTAGLTPDEAAIVAEIGAAFRTALYEDVTGLVLEIGKSPEWAQSTPLMGLMMALQEEVDDEQDIADIFARIANERAGNAEAPSAPTNDVHEAFIRRVVELGPAFEAALAERLGAARARQLREHGDGWPGNQVQTGSRCEEEP